jgi:N6-adenosine-specific RNA methylase IME4
MLILGLTVGKKICKQFKSNDPFDFKRRHINLAKKNIIYRVKKNEDIEAYPLGDLQKHTFIFFV